MPKAVTTLQKALWPLLAPLGLCYAGAMRLRSACYATGLLLSWKPPAFSVSVGNIGWGGTGKTPLVSWLLTWAGRRGLRPVVLTRGYRAHPGEYPYLVKPGALAEEAGDEPLMLALDHPGASILVDPVRIRAGKWAEKELRPNLYLLDDGFQHMAVKRDVNLVLFMPEDIYGGWNKVIPSGSWREDVEALSRADVFLVKARPRLFREMAKQMRSRLGRFRKPIFSFTIKPIGVRRLVDGFRLASLDHKRYLLVTGVGQPAQVEATVSRYLDYPPEEHMVFSDHHLFTRADVTALESLAHERGCQAILCTPKDAVKIGPMASNLFWTLDLDVVFGPSLGAGKPFDAWWDRRFDVLHLKRYGDVDYLEMDRDDNVFEDDDADHLSLGRDYGTTEEDGE
ncbi:MAG: tetraacyldisaccharide 4'-kinase [Proteobacteria bacterium]|nr:tetraacyldisaccharide 4'-kinase [Pseudomonadota bacterium]